MRPGRSGLWTDRGLAQLALAFVGGEQLLQFATGIVGGLHQGFLVIPDQVLCGQDAGVVLAETLAASSGQLAV